jgi:hypothetical protein
MGGMAGMTQQQYMSQAAFMQQMRQNQMYAE